MPRLNYKLTAPLTVLVAAVCLLGFTSFQEKPTGKITSLAANEFLKTLDAKQLKMAKMTYSDKRRLDWHFIPKAERKGLQIKHMTEKQQSAADRLLRSVLSKIGYSKAKNVMELERVLKQFQKGDSPIRDTERYYFTIFGEPSGESAWGISIEGHHLSMNFVVENEKVVSFTPNFYAANPATVKTDKVSGVKDGMRVLADEEQLAFDLVNMLDDSQKKIAIVAEKAPKEIRGAGDAQPPEDDPQGIAASKLNKKQAELLHRLIKTYLGNLPEDVAEDRMKKIVASGNDKIHFAWAGPTKPGIGHYYLVEGPDFQIEFVNTQPDSMGNPANHIHCVLRDPNGDFAIEKN